MSIMNKYYLGHIIDKDQTFSNPFFNQIGDRMLAKSTILDLHHIIVGD